MKAMLRSLLIAGLLMFGIGAHRGADATPLALSYSISGSGVYTYDFTLTLDNHDASWSAGQNFNLIIFGDEPYGVPSPLSDFSIDPTSLPVGPFTVVGAAGGGHNGPAFLQTSPSLDGWIPTAVGQTLTWSGTSSHYAGAGKLLFSDLVGNGNHANFQVAKLISGTHPVSSTPIPGALPLLVTALGGLGFVGFRRRNITPIG